MEEDVLKYMSKVKDYYLGKSNLNTNEVVKILLGRNENACNNVYKDSFINDSDNSSEFDMEELLRWKNKNNDKYEITSYLAITSHRKFIGKFLVLGKKIVRKFLGWYINPIVEQQNEFNGSVTASINALYNNEIVTQNFIKMNSNLEDRLNQLEEKNNKLKGRNNKLEDSINKLEDKNNELRQENQLLLNRLEDLMIETKGLDEKIKILTDKSERIIQTVLGKEEKIDQDLDYIKFKLSKLNKVEIENEMSKNEIQQNKQNEVPVLNQYGIDYFEFENRFRGSCKKIKETQTGYLKYFEGKENIIDIGCGRGEFLELLKENDISAIGVDVCEEFVEYCNYKNLHAIFEDAISYINKINDNSIGGVFMSQVAEHLDTNYLIELVSKLYDKLQVGSYFIAETPNPTMLSTFSNSFYLDPSHKNPVHPETFKFVLEKAGFKDIEVVYTDSSKIQYNLPLLNGTNIKNLEEFNDGVNLLSQLLFGSQDYAIIARK